MQSNPTCALKPQQLLPLSYDMFRSAGELYGERVAVSGKGKKITEPLGVLVTEKRWPSCVRVPIWSRGWSTQREDVCVLYLVSLAGSLVNTPRPFFLRHHRVAATVLPSSLRWTSSLGSSSRKRQLGHCAVLATPAELRSLLAVVCHRTWKGTVGCSRKWARHGSAS